MFLMWEISTPCVYVRWFLYNLGKHDTKAYIVNGLLMLATFFCCRNLLGLCTHTFGGLWCDGILAP